MDFCCLSNQKIKKCITIINFFLYFMKKYLFAMNYDDFKNSVVLIVDDLPQNLEVLGSTLKQKGLHIAIATNGVQALKVAEKKLPDLVLLDISMPGMDGYEVCEKLKSCPDTKDIPVIFLTAKTETEDVIKGFEAGAVDYITKPFKTSELLARVFSQLEIKKSRDLINSQKTDLEQANINKLKFFQIISRDLRGPFTGFLGISKILMEEGTKLNEKDLKELSTELHIALETQYNLLENLLEWSKIQIGKYEVNIDNIDLCDLTLNVVSAMNNLATSKDIKIEINVPRHSIIKADSEMLKRIVSNLLSNAIKFTQRGGMINISAEEDDKAITLSVKDNGIGIPENRKDNIFKIETSYKREGTEGERGTGLGLVISNELAKILNADLYFESDVNSGSSFHIKLLK